MSKIGVFRSSVEYVRRIPATWPQSWQESQSQDRQKKLDEQRATLEAAFVEQEERRKRCRPVDRWV